MRVFERVARDCQGTSGAVDGRITRQVIVLERIRIGNHFKGGPGLIARGDSQVLAQLRFLGNVVRIERRITRHGENMAVLGVQHDGRAARSFGAQNGAFQSLFSNVLDARVDGDGDVLTRNCRAGNDGTERALRFRRADVFDHAGRTADTLQFFVESLLESPGALFLSVEPTDNRRCQRGAGVHTLAFRAEFDPIETRATGIAQGVSVDRFVRRQLALDPQEATAGFFGGRDPLAQIGFIQTKSTGLYSGRHGGIFDALGIDTHAIHWHADRQSLTGGIEDGAAHLAQIHLLFLLFDGHRLQFGMLEDLQVDEPAEDDESDGIEDPRQQMQAAGRLWFVCLRVRHHGFREQLRSGDGGFAFHQLRNGEHSSGNQLVKAASARLGGFRLGGMGNRFLQGIELGFGRDRTDHIMRIEDASALGFHKEENARAGILRGLAQQSGAVDRAHHGAQLVAQQLRHVSREDDRVVHLCQHFNGPEETRVIIDADHRRRERGKAVPQSGLGHAELASFLQFARCVEQGVLSKRNIELNRAGSGGLHGFL